MTINQAKTLVPFGRAWLASGSMGFFKEGHRWHRTFWGRLFKLMWLNFIGATFVAKTITCKEHAGNMPLQSDGVTPVEKHPKCVYISFWSWLCGAMINAVGLSNKGANFYLAQKKWQGIRKPFMVSISPTEDTAERRLSEIRQIIAKIAIDWSWISSSPVAIQLNLCPNIGLNLNRLASEVRAYLNALKPLGVPVVVKVNALFPVHIARSISTHPVCAGFTVSNAIAFGDFPDRRFLKRIFGTSIPAESPLMRRGLTTAGAVSGKRLLPLELDWIRRARNEGITRHINCGSCFGPIAVFRAYLAGADSISIGTVCIHRPWMVQIVIWTAKILGPIFGFFRIRS